MDYTPTYTFTAGDPTNALEVATNMFEAHTTPTSPSVFNGSLDADNRLGSWDVTWEMARKGSFVRTADSNGSSGATANTDFFDYWFMGEIGDPAAPTNPLGDWQLETLVSAAPRCIAVPGASRSFQVPWALASAIYLNFTATVICQRGGEVQEGALPPPATNDPVGETLLLPFVNGKPLYYWARRVISSRLTLVERPTPLDAFRVDYLEPEQRTYAIHCLLDTNVLQNAVPDLATFDSSNPLFRGVHTAELRVAHREPHVRFKTCHITALPIR